MFTDLINFLEFTNFNTDNPYFIGVTEKSADSSFLFHHFTSYFLKQDCQVVLVSLCQAFNHFSGVGNKIGINLSKARDQTQLQFVDGLKLLANAVNQDSLAGGDNVWKNCVDSAGELKLTGLYRTLKETFDNINKNPNKKTVIIIDNISVLLDIGASVMEIVTFIQYLNVHINTTTRSSLVIGCQSNAGIGDDEGNLLTNYIHHLADLSILVQGLETGFCRDVHGQVHA